MQQIPARSAVLAGLGFLFMSLLVGCAPASAGCPAHGPHHVNDERPEGQGRGVVVEHAGLPRFENHGNQLVGIATQHLGAQSFEVWRTSVAPGSATPPHRHATEEIFVFLSGQGRAQIGEQILNFSAPATVIAPAHVTHQFFNTGSTPTDAIVVVGVGSSIYDKDGHEMELPWRK